MAHITRAIPAPSKGAGTDPVAEVVREIEAANRRAVHVLTVAVVVLMALALGVLVVAGVPLALVGAVAGLAVLVTFALAPRRWR